MEINSKTNTSFSPSLHKPTEIFSQLAKQYVQNTVTTAPQWGPCNNKCKTHKPLSKENTHHYWQAYTLDAIQTRLHCV